MLDAVEKVWGSTDRVIMCMSHNERMLNGPGGLGADRPKGDLVFRYPYPLSTGKNAETSGIRMISISTTITDTRITSSSTSISPS
jgi:hypothetical protein